MKIYLGDLYVVVTTGFMVFGADEHVYDNREEAETDARERQKTFKDLTFKVWDLADYLDKIRCRCNPSKRLTTQKVLPDSDTRSTTQ